MSFSDAAQLPHTKQRHTFLLVLETCCAGAAFTLIRKKGKCSSNNNDMMMMAEEQQQQQQQPPNPTQPPLTEFWSTSRDAPTTLHISFADQPATATLGVQLINTESAASAAAVADKNNNSNNEEIQSMFVPGYAIVGRLLPGDTVASRAGVRPGDCIVAVNGHGFRRFARDPNDDANDAEADADVVVGVPMDHAVVPAGPTAYQQLLEKLKAVKAAGGDPPLVLSLERHGWDARANAWGRFLAARDGSVPAAVQMLQEHEAWRSRTFPISLHKPSPGLQRILKTKAVSEIDVVGNNNNKDGHSLPPTVYVNYGQLQQLQAAGDICTDDVVAAFCIYTERLLAVSAAAGDPRHPQTCQFIDLSGVSITSGFRVDALKQIYHTFEPNYPETLYKMVIYPVSSLMSATAKTLLSFVNEKTKKKFLITNQLDAVCAELGWDKAEVEECGGVTEFMHKHEKAGDTLLFAEPSPATTAAAAAAEPPGAAAAAADAKDPSSTATASD